MGVRIGPVRHLSAGVSRRISHVEIGTPPRTLIQGLGFNKGRKEDWRTSISVPGTGRRSHKMDCANGNSVAMAQENKTVMGPALFAKSVLLHSSCICPRSKAVKK